MSQLMHQNSTSSTAQAEEIEALIAIYDGDLNVVNESKRKYEIRITDGEEDSERKVYLEVTLPEDYPKLSPPQYHIHGMWLSEGEKRQIENSLADIFIENMGECILFMWIEKIREFLQSRSAQEEDPLEGNNQLKDIPQSEGDSLEDENSHAQVVENKLTEDIENLDIQYEEYKNKKESETKDELKCPEILHGEFIHDRKSVFQAHLAPVHSKEEVNLVVDTLLENRKIAAATHNMQAYRICIEGKNTVWSQDCKDDGEIHAGNRMLHLMEILEVKNVLVVVSRWYGGIHLGPDRFKHINNCTRDILDAGGYIKTKKSEKKGPKSGKKSKKDS